MTWYMQMVRSAPVLAAVLVGAACSDDGDDTDKGVCDASCDAMLAAGCPGDTRSDCLATCNAGLADPECGDLGEALAACVAGLPPEGFQCNADGKAILGQGQCTQEIADLYAASCVPSESG